MLSYTAPGLSHCTHSITLILGLPTAFPSLLCPITSRRPADLELYPHTLVDHAPVTLALTTTPTEILSCN